MSCETLSLNVRSVLTEISDWISRLPYGPLRVEYLAKAERNAGHPKNLLKTFDIFEGRKPFRDEVSHSVISSPVTVLKCTVKNIF